MNRIVAPLNADSRGAALTDLQAGLLLLLNQGFFQLAEADQHAFQEHLGTEQAANQYGSATRKLVARFQELRQLESRGDVDEQTAFALNEELDQRGGDAEPPLRVRGRVRGPNGAVEGIEVNVYDRDLGAVRQRLGDPGQRYVTAADGRFEVTYTTEQFAAGDARLRNKPSADLLFELEREGRRIERFELFRVFEGQREEQPQAAEELRLGIQARDQEEVEIELDAKVVPPTRGPSEYERLLLLLRPVLADNRSPADFDEENHRDVSFVARETGAEYDQVALLAAAFRLAAEFGFDVPPEVFYGLARTERLTTLHGVAAASLGTLHQAVGAAVRQEIIPLLDADRLSNALELIHQSAAQRLLAQPSEGGTRLADMLALAVEAPEEQAQLLRTFANHEGDPASFWEQLAGHESLGGKVEKIQYTLQLGTLTQQNLPLMRALQTTLPEATTARALALRLNAEQLLSLLRDQEVEVPAAIPGDTLAARTSNYARTLSGLLQAAHPTATVAQLVAGLRADQLGGLQQPVARFMENAVLQTDFDLRTVLVDDFVDQHRAMLFAGVGEDVDRQQLVGQVKRVQRLFRLGVDVGSMQTLIGSSFHGAQDIALQSAQTFVAENQEALGGEEQAMLIHGRATAVSAANLFMAVQFFQAFNDVHPATADGGIKEMPSWAQLFGSVEMCDCDHCLSVYSPAAYLVDLFEFLDKKCQANPAGKKPLEILLSRRPDLAHIKLTCENTNTTIPYVDLVNEVLESYIALGGHLDSSTAHDVGDSTGPELLANPQFVLSTVYDSTLAQQAVYPPTTLPFDRSLETVRVFLEHLGRRRHEVMLAFADSLADAAATTAHQWATTSEYLGCSAQEYEILTGQNFLAEARPQVLLPLYGEDEAEVYRPLQAGDAGPAVVILQAKLNTLNAAGPLPALTLDGQFASTTEDAVKAAQQSQGLPVTGAVDAALWAALRPVAPEATAAFAAAVPQFLQRTGLQYEELLALLRTRFVNPHQQELAFLEATGLSSAELRALMAIGFASPDTALTARLTALLKPGQTLAEQLSELQAWAAQYHTLVILHAEGNQCDISNLFIQQLDGQPIDAATWFKMHRFIRLWRKLGWTMAEVDATLLAFGYVDEQVTPDCLATLGQVQQLQLQTGLPVPVLLSWWTNIATSGDQSLYQQLFQNKSVLNPLDVDFELTALRDELALPTNTITAKAPAILAALRLTADELALIRADAGLAGAAAVVTLTSLSQLQRYALLARTTGLPVAELLALRQLANATPFGRPADTIAFLELVQIYQESGFSMSQLQYFCGQPLLSPADPAMQPVQIELLATTLATGLKKLAEELAPVPSPTAAQLQDLLATVLPPAFVAPALSLIDGSSTSAAADKQELLRSQLALFGLNTAEAQARLLPTLAPLPAGADDDARDSRSQEVQGRIQFAYDRVLPYVSQLRQHSWLIQALSTAYGFNAGLLRGLLSDERLLAALSGPGSALQDFSFGLRAAYFNDENLGAPAVMRRIDELVDFSWGAAVPAPALTAPGFSVRWQGQLLAGFSEDYTFYVDANDGVRLWVDGQLLIDEWQSQPRQEHSAPLRLVAGRLYELQLEYFTHQSPARVALHWSSASLPKEVVPAASLFAFDPAGFRRLHKIALLISTLQLSLKELGLVDLSQLQTQVPPVTFGQWLALVRFVALRARFPQGPLALVEVLLAEGGARKDLLATLSGWRREAVEGALAASQLTVDELSSEAALSRLYRVMQLEKELGVPAAQLREWALNPPDYAAAQSIKSTVKAKYDPETWLNVAKPLNDLLRERQRAALVAYVLTMPAIQAEQLTTADQLFEYFLIDVEMSPCMVTSRIKQATSSVQLFVQRCLINLEKGVRPDAIDAEQWQWRKFYRVSEANRKIFVNPENYAEVSLLDNKSPFFTELEADLQQDDVTMDVAEKALLNYLNKLDEVALLDICGSYWQDKDPDTGEALNVLHVFGRTKAGNPRAYFYRRWENGSVWTAWEKVAVDIQGIEQSKDSNTSGVHLLPLIWNRRLYIFWSVFTKKTRNNTPAGPLEMGKPIQPPTTKDYWEVGLGWSRHERQKWVSKQVSYPVQYETKTFSQPDSYRLVPSFNNSGLQIRLLRYDGKAFQKQAVFSFNDCNAEITVAEETGAASGLEVLNATPSYMGFVNTTGPGFPIEFDSKGQVVRQLLPVMLQPPNKVLLPAQPGASWRNGFLFYQATPLQSRYQHPSQAYFVKTQQLNVPYLKEVATPQATTPFAEKVGTTAIKQVSLAADQLASYSADKALANPWLAAESHLAPLLSKSVLGQLTQLDTVAVSGGSSPGSPIAQTMDKKGAYEAVHAFYSPQVASRPTVSFRFETFFHPYVGEFIKALNRKGVPGLLNLQNQVLGNRYLSTRWRASIVAKPISATATGAAGVIEGTFGRKAIKGIPGNFEAVVREGSGLWHYSRDNARLLKGDPVTWQRNLRISTQADSAACIIERVSGRQESEAGVTRPGDFEVVVLEGNQLAHYTRNNANPANAWVRLSSVSTQATGAGCLIESSRTVGGQRQLDAVVLEGSALVHYQRPAAGWVRAGATPADSLITDKATGAGCLIESSFGHLEVVVLEGSQLVHYRRPLAGRQWQRLKTISTVATGAGWLLQNRMGDGSVLKNGQVIPHGNFEVVVPEGHYLVHYWKDSTDETSPWRRGQVVSAQAQSGGCLLQSSFVPAGSRYPDGNFEAFVCEPAGLVHRVNDGSQFYFKMSYDPSENTQSPYPRHEVDFSYGGAYSQYNWELFFYVPLLLATHLSRNFRFEEAQQCFHYHFHPMDSSEEAGDRRYWKVLPLRDVERQRLDQLLALLQPGDNNSPEEQLVVNQIRDWEKHPFRPHRVARLRPIAYKKHVVMKYLDNELAWGDHCFRRADAMKSIELLNEATQHYITCANLLGPRPQRIPAQSKPRARSYAELRPLLSEWSNAQVEFENQLPFSSTLLPASGSGEVSALLGMGSMPYFGLPQNEQLLSYWDTVADRLFKIRHCLNIEGVALELPLYEPPIDPALLVQAAAKGVDIASVLSDLHAPLPRYRFPFLLQKTVEICHELKSLGSLFTAAREKKDAERIATLRTSHEVALLSRVRSVKEDQYKEAGEAYNALLKSREVEAYEFSHYQRLLGLQEPKVPDFQADGFDLNSPGLKLEPSQGSAGSVPLSEQEQSELNASHSARDWLVRSATTESLASLSHYIPMFVAKASPLSVGVDMQFGGQHVGPALMAISRYQKNLGEQDSYDASHAGRMSTHLRRQQDWLLRRNTAGLRLIQLNKQLAAMAIGVEVSRKQLEVHDFQVEQAQALYEDLRTKYTNEELYDWMIGALSRLYFQTYQLVYEWARKLERCYCFECGLLRSNFVQYGTWDSLRNGLLAGEQLYLQLRQMEKAYLEQPAEYQLTKHIALSQLDPLALLLLRQTGECTVTVPEAFLDMDGAGHYMRRLKSVALTIPCVAGPHTGVSCTLTLLNSSVRHRNTLLGGKYARQENDPRFVDDWGAVQSIVTSSAQVDSGRFETNLRDEQYLPFEGAGAISKWRLQLPKKLRQFDYDTITDVVLHFRLTAREGGAPLRAGSEANVEALLGAAQAAGSLRLFSLRHDFPSEWARFQAQPAEANQRFEFTLRLGREHYPFWSQDRLKTVKRIDLLAKAGANTLVVADKRNRSDATAKKDTLAKNPALGNLLAAQLSNLALPAKPLVDGYKLYFEDKAVDDLWIGITWSSK